jgi:hypothetical protein
MTSPDRPKMLNIVEKYDIGAIFYGSAKRHL